MLLLENFEVHETLNPKLWENNKLKPEVRSKLFEIVNHFIDECDAPLHVVDVHIVGSQASYNYTKYSDLDVHLICNFELVDCPDDLLQLTYNYVKSSYNKDYNITIHGVEVELYIEDINSTAVSNGVYSLYSDKWIKEPKKIDISINVDSEVKELAKDLENTLKFGTHEEVSSAIDDLYRIRQASLITDGEYSKGNQLFKEIRNLGLLTKLKERLKELESKQLSLEHLEKTRLTEDSRTTLLNKSKQTDKGFQRFKQRVKSRVANTVKQYNSIDMNKLFKDNILTVDVNVKGETDDYTVKISFGGFLDLLQDQVNHQNGQLNYKAVTRALILGFNKDDVYISCTCPDWKYRFAYFATRNDINSGTREDRPSDITNPDDNLGSACKHVLLVLSNTSFLLKVASTIYNYINYMQKHYEKLYADVIYPAVYGKDYEEPVQLDLIDTDELDTDKETIDKSNEYAVDKTKFKQGNKQGVRFASANKDEDQLSLDTSDSNPENSLETDDSI